MCGHSFGQRCLHFWTIWTWKANAPIFAIWPDRFCHGGLHFLQLVICKRTRFAHGFLAAAPGFLAKVARHREFFTILTSTFCRCSLEKKHRKPGFIHYVDLHTCKCALNPNGVPFFRSDFPKSASRKSGVQFRLAILHETARKWSSPWSHDGVLQLFTRQTFSFRISKVLGAPWKCSVMIFALFSSVFFSSQLSIYIFRERRATAFIFLMEFRLLVLFLLAFPGRNQVSFGCTTWLNWSRIQKINRLLWIFVKFKIFCFFQMLNIYYGKNKSSLVIIKAMAVACFCLRTCAQHDLLRIETDVTRPSADFTKQFVLDTKLFWGPCGVRLKSRYRNNMNVNIVKLWGLVDRFCGFTEFREFLVCILIIISPPRCYNSLTWPYQLPTFHQLSTRVKTSESGPEMNFGHGPPSMNFLPNFANVNFGKKVTSLKNISCEFAM